MKDGAFDFVSFQYPSKELGMEYDKGESVIFEEEKRRTLRMGEVEREKERPEEYAEEMKAFFRLGEKEYLKGKVSFEKRMLGEISGMVRGSSVESQLWSRDIFSAKRKKSHVLGKAKKLSKAVVVKEGIGGERDRIKIKIGLSKLKPESLHIFHYKDKEIAVQMLPDGKIKFFEVIEE